MSVLLRPLRWVCPIGCTGGRYSTSKAIAAMRGSADSASRNVAPRVGSGPPSVETSRTRPRSARARDSRAREARGRTRWRACDRPRPTPHRPQSDRGPRSRGPVRRHHWRGARRARAGGRGAAIGRRHPGAGRHPRGARSRRPGPPAPWPPIPCATMRTYRPTPQSCTPRRRAAADDEGRGPLIVPERHHRDLLPPGGRVEGAEGGVGTTRGVMRDGAVPQRRRERVVAVRVNGCRYQTRSPGVRWMGKRPASISGLTCSTTTRCARRSGRGAGARRGGERSWCGARARAVVVRWSYRSSGWNPRGRAQVAPGATRGVYRMRFDGGKDAAPSILEPHARPPQPAISCDCVRGGARHLQRSVDVYIHAQESANARGFEHEFRPSARAAAVTAVRPTGVAARAGLRTGDQIVAIDGQPLDRTDRLLDAFGRTPPGRSLSLQVDGPGGVRRLPSR